MLRGEVGTKMEGYLCCVLTALGGDGDQKEEMKEGGSRKRSGGGRR